MTDNTRVAPNVSRVIFGLAVIAAGVLFTLDNLRILDAGSYFSYWPILLVFIGLAQIAQSATWGGYIWGAVLAFAGVWILGENLDIVPWSIWTVSPLLLVALGLSIIWRGWRPAAGAVGGSAAVDDRSYIRGTAVMGGFDRTSDSSDFRGGDLMMIMGGSKLDLRTATIAGNEAVIDLLVIMGGVELRVPETWSVETHVLPIMGGVTNRARTPQNAPAQRLVLRGNVFMGGVEIKN